MIDLYFFQLSVPYLWLAAGIIIASTEFLFPTQLSMWSGAAAFIVGLLCITGIIPYYSFHIQLLVFAILSISLIMLWFFVAKRYIKFGRSILSDARDDTLSGIKGRVTEVIEPGKPGEVMLFNPYHGLKQWKADSDDILEVDTVVVVIEARGNHIIVKKSE